MQRVGLSHLCILEYSQCDTKVEKDDQQTETMMVPATLTHFVTIAANLTKRKRPEEQLSTTQGKEGEHAQNIWKEGNFQLFLFEILPLKNWPCRSANLILKLRSVFMRTRQNPCLVCAFTLALFFYTNKRSKCNTTAN